MANQDLGVAMAYSKGWVATYEIWSIDNRNVVASFSLDLPDTDMAVLLYDGMDWLGWNDPRRPGPQFEFPVAISPDLRSFIILDHLMIINRKKTHPNQEWVASHQKLNILRVAPRQGTGRIDALRSYQAWFSPTGEFAIFLEPNSLIDPKNVEGSFCPKYWSLSARKLSHSSQDLRIPRLKIEYFNIPGLDIDYRRPGDFARIFCFHPSLPVVAVSSKRETTLWNISDPGMWPPCTGLSRL